MFSSSRFHDEYLKLKAEQEQLIEDNERARVRTLAAQYIDNYMYERGLDFPDEGQPSVSPLENPPPPTTARVTDSKSLLRSRIVVAHPYELEEGAQATSKVLTDERQRGLCANAGTSIVNVIVRGRLVDRSGITVLDVYPFVVRHTGAGDDFVHFFSCKVREHLCAGVHPAPCSLYARRGASKGSTDARVEGADVVVAAKAALGAGVEGSYPPLGLWWEIHVCVAAVTTNEGAGVHTSDASGDRPVGAAMQTKSHYVEAIPPRTTSNENPLPPQWLLHQHNSTREMAAATLQQRLREARARRSEGAS